MSKLFVAPALVSLALGSAGPAGATEWITRPSAPPAAGTSGSADLAAPVGPVAPLPGFAFGTTPLGLNPTPGAFGFDAKGFASSTYKLGNGWTFGLQSYSGTGAFTMPGAAPGLAFEPGAEFNATRATLAYQAGRFTPFVTTGLDMSRSQFTIGRSGPSLVDPVSPGFASSGTTMAAPTIAAGFNYALTNSTTVSLGVSVTRSPALVSP